MKNSDSRSSLVGRTPRARPNGKRPRLELEALEVRALLSAGLYSITGTGNNLTNTAWGSALSDLLRISPVAYTDGVSSPSLANNPSARVVSDILNNQADPNNPSQELSTLNGNSLSDFGYVWGQFIDHDMDLTTTNSSDLLTITADPNDPSQMGDQTFARSTSDSSTGTSTSNPRQQVNSVTSFLDLSQVYGSSAGIADALRTHTGGLMKTSPGNMLPYDNSTYFTSAQLSLIHMANDSGAVATQNLFVTGDVRGNENVELTALQTLFVRNHNQIAGQLQKLHPTWTDEQLYQEARRLNIAEYQQITYNYYLPDLLGSSALPAYAGYKSNVDPAIATEFSTIAFRFGHSLLDSDIGRQGNNGLDVLPNDPAGANISLATDFFDPNVLNPQGVIDPLTGHTSTDIGPILKSDADGISQADDLMAVNDIRNLLFGNGGAADNGLDLMARDVERARDNGIGTYNQVRVAYGLAPVTSFAQITSNVTVQQELQKAYGTVDNIDPFEGGLAEDHVKGSDMGPLFTRILADQFTRLRDGDRNFYLNQSFSAEELKIMGQDNTLAKVIESNTNITNLQSDVFLYKTSISGTVLLNNGSRSPQGLAGATVQLNDDSGGVIATTTTDSKGQYHFDQQSGLSGTGSYTVSLVVPAGDTQISLNPSPILYSRGDMNVTGVNFVVTQSTQPATHFEVSVPKSVQSGQSFDILVKAEDASNRVASGYTGTVHFTLGTADAGATLPADYTFTASDHGVHVFHVTLAANGSESIVATDTATAAITGKATTTVFTVGPATHFALMPAKEARVGDPTQFVLVALDAANHVVTGYTGTVHFTSSDGNAKLPADYTFTTADHGSHLFSVTLFTPGMDTLTATDTSNSAISGTVNDWVFSQLPWGRGGWKGRP